MSSDINRHGLILLGCGKMGQAMLAGWLDQGIAPDACYIIEPNPQSEIEQLAVHLNSGLPETPAVVILAVKPQVMEQAIKQVTQFSGADTLFISVAAGLTLDWLGTKLGARAAIIRTIPNTPAAIGRGITAFIGNSNSTDRHLKLAQQLLGAVGQVVELENEAQMDAVTALSGSGPAYVFYLIEVMSRAGQRLGLPREVADKLALATVEGAGALARHSAEDPRTLRKNVTSPNGTTQAGLDVLMDAESGLEPLIERTIRAATDRSKELADG